MKPILQVDSTDCALACLATLHGPVARLALSGKPTKSHHAAPALAHAGVWIAEVRLTTNSHEIRSKVICMLKKMDVAEAEGVLGGAWYDKVWNCARVGVDEAGVGLGYTLAVGGTVAAVAGVVTLNGPVAVAGVAAAGAGVGISNGSLSNLDNSKKACSTSTWGW